jgi:hypothetical protein
MASVDSALAVSVLTKQSEAGIISKELIHEYGYTQVWKAELSRDMFRMITEVEVTEVTDGEQNAVGSYRGSRGPAVNKTEDQSAAV